MQGPELKSHILSEIDRRPSPTRAEVARRERQWLAAGTLVALAIFLAAGGFRQWGAPRPAELTALTTTGTAALAAVALRISWFRGRSMLGPPTATLIGLAVGAPVALFALKLGSAAFFAGALGWLTDRMGLKCMSLSLSTGAALLTALLATRRGSDPVHPGWGGVALGVASGASSAVFVDLWCPVSAPSHVLIGHVLPILALGLAGGLAGRRALAMR